MPTASEIFMNYEKEELKEMYPKCYERSAFEKKYGKIITDENSWCCDGCDKPPEDIKYILESDPPEKYWSIALCAECYANKFQ